MCGVAENIVCNHTKGFLVNTDTCGNVSTFTTVQVHRCKVAALFSREDLSHRWHAMLLRNGFVRHFI